MIDLLYYRSIPKEIKLTVQQYQKPIRLWYRQLQYVVVKQWRDNRRGYPFENKIKTVSKYLLCSDATLHAELSRVKSNQPLHECVHRRKFNPRGSNFPSTGPLHQFARDAVYLTNDQILYAKKSTRDIRSLRHFLLFPLFLSTPSALFRLKSVRDTFHRCEYIYTQRRVRFASSRILRDIIMACATETDRWYMKTSNATFRGNVSPNVAFSSSS